MKLRIGNIVVESVVDHVARHARISEVFAEATADAVEPHRHYLEPHALCPETQRLIIPVQSYLVRTRHHVMLLDTCVGCHKQNPDFLPWHQRTDETWLARLARAGVTPEQVTHVFCTHLHSDHCGYNTRLRDGRWVPTFPNARYVISKAEVEATERRGGAAFEESVRPILEAGQARLVELDFALDDEVWLEPTTGHTEGHVSVHLKSGDYEAAMSGDLIHSPIQCAHPEWSPRFDRDPEAARVTRRRFLERHCDTSTVVLTAHFPAPSVGHVKREGEAFRFDYLST